MRPGKIFLANCDTLKQETIQMYAVDEEVSKRGANLVTTTEWSRAAAITLARHVIPTIVAVVAISSAHAQERFPDVPENHWVFETLMNFKRSLVPAIPSEVFRGTQTRRDVALAIIQVYDRLQKISDRIYIKDTVGLERRELQRLRDEAQVLSAHREDVSKLADMVDLFASELTSMGWDPQQLKRGIWAILTKNSEMRMRLESAETLDLAQFSDVPHGHWVYEAVYKGRNNEHFFGYPSDLFRGGSSLNRYEMAGVVNAFYQHSREQMIRILEQFDWIRRVPDVTRRVSATVGRVAR
jgi:hypothetical protein